MSCSLLTRCNLFIYVNARSSWELRCAACLSAKQQERESHRQLNLQGKDMHFLFKKNQKNWDAVPEAINNTNRAAQRGENGSIPPYTSHVFLSSCHTMSVYLWLTVCAWICRSMHVHFNVCVCVCERYTRMLVSLLRRADCLLALQGMTSQSYRQKNMAALTPIFHRFTHQQQQSGQTHTHPHTHWGGLETSLVYA